IFGKLVSEKTAGGYKALAAPRPVAPAPAPAAAAAAARPPLRERDAALVARLQRGDRGDDALGPHVWRASDRDYQAAEPALRELLDAPAPGGLDRAAWQHSLVSALARCGTTATLPRLDKLVHDPRTPPHVRDVARLAIVRIDPARSVELARPGLVEPL